MNFEKLQNIGSKIETNDLEERREALLQKIEQISLVYADKKFQEIKKSNDTYKFSDALKDFTPTENVILKPTFHLEKFSLSKNKEKIDLFLNNFYSEVDCEYGVNGFDLDKFSELVKFKKDSIRRYLDVENLKEVDYEKLGETKLLGFNEIVNAEHDNNGRYKDLDKNGFSKSDQFVEVHVEDFYDTGEKNLGPELIRNDFGAVAEYIVDKKPEAAAVVGKSWLLNTPIANRLGFNKIEGDTDKQNDFSAWLQFIDKNGQIDKKRFDEFLKTGELPFKSVIAYIPTEDFLKKYLPENRRGKVVLKEIDRSQGEFWFKLKGELELVKTDWDTILSNGGFDEFVKNNKALNEVLNLLDSNDKGEYLDFFKKMYNSNIPWKGFYEHKDEKIIKMDDKINEVMKNRLYKDKEIIVE